MSDRENRVTTFDGWDPKPEERARQLQDKVFELTSRLAAAEAALREHREALEWIVKRDADHRKFGCVNVRDKWHCSEWCAVGKAAGALTSPPAMGAREPGYACADCGKLRTVDEGGLVFTVCDECWDRKYAQPDAADEMTAMLQQVADRVSALGQGQEGKEQKSESSPVTPLASPTSPTERAEPCPTKAVTDKECRGCSVTAPPSAFNMAGDPSVCDCCKVGCAECGATPPKGTAP